ncbi:cellulose biosynthesis protein BcsC [Variovorax sp. PBS-H4]|uniref:cellulose biosynthesis protein BcsC n=1 Tax=Variovorax sp. PBS-H4 TaxID=434008 RepID=UPI0013A5A4F4|nr:cellulose biosynthesis protein BcsC [Variovorax sp. PBS-H4]
MPRAALRLRRLACIAAWAALGTGPVAAQADARAALADQAIHWQSIGRLELAEASWRKLLSADPQSADALYGLAQVALARGEVEPARAWLARLRAAHPSDARAIQLEARLGRPGGQAADLQVAREAARAGRTSEALQAYRALFGERAPPEALALEYYQLLAGTPEGWEPSRRDLEQLVRNRPERQDFRLALAQLQTYRETTRREGIRTLAELARQQPAGTPAREAWRQALLWLDARAADAPLYRDYLALQADPAVAQRLAQLGEAPPQAPRPAPPNPVQQGYAALDRGDLATAERRFDEALRMRPADTDALGGLGLVRLRQQRFAQAEDLLGRASRNGARRWASALRSASYWNLLGQATAARERSDFAGARELLERAVRIDPAEPAAREAMADLQRTRDAQARAQARQQRDAGDLAGARLTLEAALVEAPGDAWLRHDLALLYRRLGLAAQARELTQAWPPAQRDTPEALYVQALLAADEGDAQASALYLERIPPASRTADMDALQDRLRAMALVPRSDVVPSRAEAPQAEAASAPRIAAGPVYRHRRGEAGLGRLTDVQTPVEARIPYGEGRITLGVTPTVLQAGTLSPDPGSAARFGNGAPAAALQAAGAVAPPGAQTERGVGMRVGYEGPNFSASLGTTPIGFTRTNVIGELGYRAQFTDTLALKAELSRRPVTDSLLSFAGTRDPRTGAEWGGVVATGGRLDLARDAGTHGFYGYGAAHALTGRNVASNTRHELGGGVYVPVLRGEDASLTVGMNLGFISYDKNLSHFTFGEGGYFSPQRYASLTFPLDWRGRDGRLSWRLSASIGRQSFREDPSPGAAANGFAGLPAIPSRRSGFAYDVAAVLEYQLGPQLYLGGALGFNNARDYRQVTGNAYLRYVFGGGEASGLREMTERPFGSPYTPLFLP